MSSDKVRDVYLVYSSTHSCHDACLTNSIDSFHMTPHKEWFFKYKIYDGGDVFLRDESTYKITGNGRDKEKIRDGRDKTLPHVLHILGLTRNPLFVSKMSDVGVQEILKKDIYNMVRGALLLERGVYIGKLYNLEASTISYGYNSFMVSKDRNKIDRTYSLEIKRIIIWNHRMDHIGEKGI